MIDQAFIDAFRSQLTERQNELRDACTTGNAELESFGRACTEILCESGVLVDEPEFLMVDDSGYRVDAVCWPDEDQPIVEFLAFIAGAHGDQLQDEVTKAFEKTVQVLRAMCKPTGRTVPAEVEKVIQGVHTAVPNPDAVLVRIVTDSQWPLENLEKKLKQSLRRRLPDGISTDLRLCDICALYQSSDGGTLGPTMEFPESGVGSVRCFCVHRLEDHDVYLAAFPGQVLASAFREYGQRLLQKNVRAFLGLKVLKNRKIADTVVKWPQRFLAYNNGLTVTANDLQVSSQNYLRRIDDMQIVNGGQTVAVLASAFRANDARCLESVIVTAKIIHVKNRDQHSDWIEKIAETSNTQNAIKDADLSSHNPAYVAVKRLSETTVFRNGADEYKWYFSRVRNEYKAELEQNRKRGHIAKREFEATYPKARVFEKGLLARAEVVFRGRPWMASRGEAKCHADFLANLPPDFVPDSDWYRRLIAKILVLKHAETTARELGIKEGRSCIVEYACALVASHVDTGRYLSRVHIGQSVHDTLSDKVKSALTQAHEWFSGLDSNRSIKEHAKREETWLAFIRSSPIGTAPQGGTIG